ncbi:myosin-16-like [Mercenaria mercenaria]|uniref:myosin-16-like n=1 Tax=Mercenaria mercenaria TaxID=6596 RepID=UPI00234EF09E|nr:myosin-16-like [Mercenaria mercenaria]
MAKKNTLNINPVFNHKQSIALVDTAEDLVDSLDNLSVCLKHIEEIHVQNKDEASKGETSLYEKLRENLDVAQDLTDTLKREKWRLNRRQMSVELRMGELEEYKSHMKEDMTDMNQTVESLSMRIIQLEDALVEAQELQEHTEAERAVTQKRLDVSEKTIKDLEDKQAKLTEEIGQLKPERKVSVLKRQLSELADRVEILTLENTSLKDLIREKEETEQHKQTTHGSVTDASKINGQKETGHIVTENNSKYDEYIGDNKEQQSPCSPVFTQTTEIAYVCDFSYEKSNLKRGETVYRETKENLEVHEINRHTETEKWRLSRRQMSVELRMGELEDYKLHFKQDMTDMNQTVESLSMRLMQLEDALVEAQELQEHTEAERTVTQKRLDESEKTIKDLEDKEAKMIEEIRQLKLERKDSVLKRQHSELADRVEILMLENKSLKDLIREKEETEHQIEANANSVTNASETNVKEEKDNIVTESSCECDEKMADQNGQKSPPPPEFTQTTEIAYV